MSLRWLREEHLSKSLISNVQPGLINNFVPYNNRYDVFYEKYMPIKTSFHAQGAQALICVSVVYFSVYLF